MSTPSTSVWPLQSFAGSLAERNLCLQWHWEWRKRPSWLGHKISLICRRRITLIPQQERSINPPAHIQANRGGEFNSDGWLLIESCSIQQNATHSNIRANSATLFLRRKIASKRFPCTNLRARGELTESDAHALITHWLMYDDLNKKGLEIPWLPARSLTHLMIMKREAVYPQGIWI